MSDLRLRKPETLTDEKGSEVDSDAVSFAHRYNLKPASFPNLLTSLMLNFLWRLICVLLTYQQK